MAEFQPAFDHVMAIEKWVLTDKNHDRGGVTYAGITRRSFPKWAGWTYIAEGKTPPRELVEGLYRTEFWDKVRGDSLISQAVATSVFSFAVNAGGVPAVKAAQRAAQVTDDGVVGKMTLFALNSMPADIFLARFALAKISHYRDLCMEDRTQVTNLLGWVNRTLSEV